MSRQEKDLLAGPDHVAQDGTRPPRSAKEAAQKLFSKTMGKDTAAKLMVAHSEASVDPAVETENNPAGLEDPAELLWDTVSTPAILAIQSNQDPEPTLREIFAAIPSCNTNLCNLTTEFKGVKN